LLCRFAIENSINLRLSLFARVKIMGSTGRADMGWTGNFEVLQCFLPADSSGTTDFAQRDTG
jgi:hypothetical protein